MPSLMQSLMARLDSSKKSKWRRQRVQPLGLNPPTISSKCSKETMNRSSIPHLPAQRQKFNLTQSALTSLPLAQVLLPKKLKKPAILMTHHSLLPLCPQTLSPSNQESLSVFPPRSPQKTLLRQAKKSPNLPLNSLKVQSATKCTTDCMLTCQPTRRDNSTTPKMTPS